MRFPSASLGLSATLLAATLALAARPVAPPPAALFGGDPFIGQIMMFGGNFAPRGWALCDGQLLSIAQNQALFSILGTTYGGDGETTFALPDLRGRAPIHPGQGPGLSNYRLGQKGGVEQVTLTANQMPSHDHMLIGSAGPGGSGMPAGRTMASTTAGRIYGPTADAPMSADAISNTGGNQAHENRPPHLAVNYIIALVGVFPSEN